MRHREVLLTGLALVAIGLAACPIALLGIGHPLAQGLVAATVAAFGWTAVRPRPTLDWLLDALDLRLPGGVAVWIWVAAAGLVSAGLRWVLSGHLPAGGWGLEFYDGLLRSYEIIGADGGGVRWSLLAAVSPVVALIVLLDGVFYCGLIQTWIVRRTNLHAGVGAQAVLFALPHVFSGAEPDVAYGVGAAIAGLAYGYLYARLRTHWVPTILLSLHVLGVWGIMLWTHGS